MARPSLLLASSFVLLIAAWLGATNPGGYVWVERLLHHSFLFGVAVLTLLSAAIGSRFRPSFRRTAVLLVVVVPLVAHLGWPLVFLQLQSLGLKELRQIPAPGDAPYTAVVSEGTAVIDPVWVVSIRQSRGILSREWQVGCLDGDAPQDGYKGMIWLSPTELSIRTEDGRQLSVQVDDDSGQPRNPIATGSGC
jgi:hypothetical protein